MKPLKKLTIISTTGIFQISVLAGYGTKGRSSTIISMETGFYYYQMVKNLPEIGIKITFKEKEFLLQSKAK